MSKLQRKSAKLFAENAVAGVGGIGQFGSLAVGNLNYSKDPDVIQALQAFSDGWSAAVTGNKSPAIEDRNALDYLLSYQQAYIMQRGVPEWIGTETYYEGSFVSKADGKMYVSKIDNNTNHDPDTDTTETYWLRFPTPAEVAAKVEKSGDTMTGQLYLQQNGVNVPYMMPAGVIQMSPLSSLTGYLLCNGQAVSRTTYANLFAAIGTSFGAGDGVNTFNVPDYRGCFLRGLGGGSAADTHTKQAMGAPDITGTHGSGEKYNDVATTGAFYKLPYTNRTAGDGTNNPQQYGFAASRVNSVYGAANEIRPVNFAINYFIKY